MTFRTVNHLEFELLIIVVLVTKEKPGLTFAAAYRDDSKGTYRARKCDFKIFKLDTHNLPINDLDDSES